MAEFDFNNIFGNDSTDISKILFDENQVSIIRDQFQKDIINPLFLKYRDLSEKLQDKIVENINNKSFIDESSDILGIKKYKKTREINKKLDDIVNPFISKISNYYDQVGKNLEDFSNFKFLPNIDFTGLNEKLKEKFSKIENNIDEVEIEIPKKRNRSKLKERSTPPLEFISDTIENYIPPQMVEPKKEIELQPSPPQIIEPKKEIESFTLKNFRDEFFNNITILIKEIPSIRETIEKLNVGVFSIKSFVSEYIPKLQTNISDGADTGGEQKTIGEKTKEIDLSEKTLKYLKDIFLSFPVDDKKDDIKMDTNSAIQKYQEEGGFWANLLKNIGGALLGAGVLMSTIGPLWDNLIKPYLEDMLGSKIKNFDELLGKFSKIWEGMEKWLTLGGTGGIGFALKIQGKVFETIADILEHSIGGIFGKVGGEALGKGTGEVAALLPKIGAKLFGGLSKIALKAIPYVGSLFSFYFAKQDYDEGDYVGMGLNIVSGLASLVPGFGIPLSIGIDVLNAMLEYNAGGEETMEGKQNAKINYLTKIYDFIREIPLIGGLIKWGEGFFALGQGDWRKAVDLLTETPFLGPLPGILQALLNSGAFGGDGSESFSWDKFNDEMKKSMFRWICSFVPKLGGMRGAVAKWMGVSYDDNTGDIQIDENALSVTEKLNQEVKSDEQVIAEQRLEKAKSDTDKPIVKDAEKIQKAIDEYQKQIEQFQTEKKQIEEELKTVLEDRIGPSIPLIHKKSREERIEEAKLEPANLSKSHNERELKQKLSSVNTELERIALEQQKFKDITIEKADDLFDSPNNLFSNVSNISEGKYYYNPENNTKTYLNQNDQVYAMQRGGIIEESINKQLGEFTNVLLAGLREFKETSSGAFVNNPVNNINLSNISSNNGASDNYTSGKRDPIYDLRMEWWKNSTLERVC